MQLVDNVPHVHLQNIGLHPAKKVSELKVGDTIVYNFAYTATVVAIAPCGKSSVMLTTKGPEVTAKEYTKRRALETYVAVRR